jgi:hypothetical protein
MIPIQAEEFVPLPHPDVTFASVGEMDGTQVEAPPAANGQLKTEADPYRLAEQLAKAKTAGRHYRDDVLGDAFLAVAEGATTRDEIENAIRCAVIKEWTYSDRNGPICDLHEPIGPPERARFDIWGEVYRLPPRQRLAAVLVFCEGFTEEEAAKEMGCTRDTVHGYINCAIRKLREKFCAHTPKSAFRFP